MLTMPSRRQWMLIALGLLATVFCTWLDLWSKDWAIEHLSLARSHDRPPLCAPDSDGRISMQRLRGPAVVWIEDYLELRYAENCGAAFGLFHDTHPVVRQVVFTVAAIAASVMLILMFVRGRGGPLFLSSVPLVVGGALGNMIDRMQHGFVVDFVRFHWRNGWEYPTFNVADAWITIGVVLLLLDGIFESRREAALRQRKSAAPASSTAVD